MFGTEYCPELKLIFQDIGRHFLILWHSHANGSTYICRVAYNILLPANHDEIAIDTFIETHGSGNMVRIVKQNDIKPEKFPDQKRIED